MVEKLSTNLTAKDIGSTLNMLRYIVNNRIKNMVNTMMIVKVTAVNGEKIDVQNVIQELDNNGTPIGIYDIPDVRYINWHYGTNKIICKPAVGDIGILLVSKQDISGLVKGGESIAQTKANFNVGDGIYIGGLEGMNGEATQFIEFDNDVVKVTGTGDITVESTGGSGKITLKAKTVNIEATDTKISATDAVIEATNATIDSANIKLGGSGAAKKIALNGDQVKNGNTVVGTIVASSTTTSAL